MIKPILGLILLVFSAPVSMTMLVYYWYRSRSTKPSHTGLINKDKLGLFDDITSGNY